MSSPRHDSPLTRLRLGFAGPGGCAEPHLSVDGMTPAGPNLSHWPGNRTPAVWKADLSTEICFRFARAEPAAQAGFLGEVEVVLNDHYDTDGFGALLAILRPELAAGREELLRSAAATGDFGCWQTWRGFAVDRIVRDLASEHSPVKNVFARCRDDAERSLRRYEWLLENAVSVLDHTGGYRSLYEEEMAAVQGEITAGLAGAIERQRHPELGVAVLASAGPRHRMVLNTLAGAFRVLHVDGRSDGPRYRFHDRTESWFELVSIAPPPRRDLRRLCERLAVLEPPQQSAGQAIGWHADPPDAPIPELYFGVAAEQEYGRITRELAPSRLDRSTVTAELLRFFAEPT
ncbi:MAG: hypothetical protein KDE27_25120 [Planctomycetes bacterium]|nr:hypothetical protein [Planctomycetota bacterium]